MRITLERAIRRGKVDHGTNQLATSLYIQKGHILTRSRLGHTGISSMKRSPPLRRIGERLVAHPPMNTFEGRPRQNSHVSAGGKKHRPVEIPLHGPRFILAHASKPTLHQLAIPP